MGNDRTLPTAAQVMLGKLKLLKERLARTIEEDIRPKLMDTRISESVREALKEKQADLERTIHEITLLENRLTRL